jgi:hypothetical protein
MKPFCSLILALIAVVGCQRQPTEPELRPVTIEVITDAAQVDALVKEWAAEREKKLEALLREPKEIREYDDESVNLIREHRNRSQMALIALRDDPSKPAPTRIEAIVALHLLEVPPSPALLAQLGASSDEAADALLRELFGLYEDDETPEPIKQFVVASMRNPDPKIRDEATRVAGWRRIAEASEIVAARIRNEPGRDLWLLEAGAKLCPSPEVLRLLKAQLQPMTGLEGLGFVGAIADLAQSTTDPLLQHQAARVVVDHLKEQEDAPWTTGDVYSTLTMLGDLKPPQTARLLLSEIIRSAKWTSLRNDALGKLHQLDEPAARQLATETGLELPSAGSSPESEPQRAPEEIAAISTRHGVLTTTEADLALAKWRKAAREDSSEGGVEAFLEHAGRLVTFDTETDMFPNRHDLLIMEFGRASAGKFKPDAAIERFTKPGEPDKSKTEYTVEFVHNRRLYRFKPNDLGDWYDVDAVVKAIHRALEDAGIAERFGMLDGWDQIATFIFAKPEALRSAASELNLKLSEDADAARKSGRDHEEKVLEKLK